MVDQPPRYFVLVMGYRSDVAIGIAFDTYEQFVSFVTKTKLSPDFSQEEFDAYYHTIYKHGESEVHTIYMYNEDVKWYPGYPDVEWHNKLMEEAKKSDASVYFIRIGEELGDIETDYSSSNSSDSMDALFNMMGVNQSIYAPVSEQSVTEFLSLSKGINHESL